MKISPNISMFRNLLLVIVKDAELAHVTNTYNLSREALNLLEDIYMENGTTSHEEFLILLENPLTSLVGMLKSKKSLRGKDN